MATDLRASVSLILAALALKVKQKSKEFIILIEDMKDLKKSLIKLVQRLKGLNK